jgi:hypothetical protein
MGETVLSSAPSALLMVLKDLKPPTGLLVMSTGEAHSS